jgi:Tfp pilus assembly protein PilE
MSVKSIEGDIPSLGKVETIALGVLALCVVYVVYQVYKQGVAAEAAVKQLLTNVQNFGHDVVTDAENFVSTTIDGWKSSASTAASEASQAIAAAAAAPQTAMTQDNSDTTSELAP